MGEADITSGAVRGTAFHFRHIDGGRRTAEHVSATRFVDLFTVYRLLTATTTAAAAAAATITLPL